MPIPLISFLELNLSAGISNSKAKLVPLHPSYQLFSKSAIKSLAFRQQNEKAVDLKILAQSDFCTCEWGFKNCYRFADATSGPKCSNTLDKMLEITAVPQSELLYMASEAGEILFS